MTEFIEKKELKEEICKNILTELPEWFAKKNAVRQYAKNCCRNPFWAVSENGKWVAFAAMKETSRYTAEIEVMGVLKEYQNRGVGTALFRSFYAFAKEKGYEFIQVKTVKQGKYKIYDLTNSFYKKLGFKELECIDDLWDKNNPCQIYIMTI